MNFSDLVGKRFLLRLGGKIWSSSDPVNEYKVLEVAPSGNWLKLKNIHGRDFWVASSDVALVEELRDFRAERMAERSTLR